MLQVPQTSGSNELLPPNNCRLTNAAPQPTPTNQERELNPYLKDGGSGVPPEAARGAAAEPIHRAAGVGDGGASWRLKALKRAQAQAGEEVRGTGMGGWEGED